MPSIYEFIYNKNIYVIKINAMIGNDVHTFSKIQAQGGTHGTTSS